MPIRERNLNPGMMILLMSDSFFERVDRVLRRSLGVSESAKADATVRPAPPVEYAQTVPVLCLLLI